MVLPVARAQDLPKLRLIGGSARVKRGERAGQFDELSDAQLVALVAEGDRVGFEALYRRHAGFALGLAVRIQGSSTDVEDIVHDAFLRARTRLADLKDAAAFRGWLGSIVVRLVRTRLRRRRLLGALGLANVEPVDLDAIASQDADTESRVLLAQVYGLLQTLPASDRIAWTLRFIERHRLEMVAELMECSLATAKRRILRAQQFLAGHFVPPFPKASP
jgi:RNA polymerase sigma-70 factor (ECF subfamily)